MKTLSPPAHRYAFVCPQCGCPTHGSPTSAGQCSSYCEDCLGDREIDDSLLPAASNQ